MKNKIFVLFIITFFLLSILTASGCGREAPPRESKLSIVCTVFPQYDWVRQIAGEKSGDMDITLLLGNKTDLHSYQPSVDDIVKVTTSDLFIYVGGISDDWVDGALKNAVNQNMIVINLMEALGDSVKHTEIVEGMEADEHGHEGHDDDDNDDDDDDDHDADHNRHGDHDDEYDEHIWLSLRNAQALCSAIAGALSKLDAGNSGIYETNLKAYNEKLAALDAGYQAAAGAARVNTMLFGDRFPFRYLADDYGVKYYAAFTGCSAETEVSFETIIFLARKMDELDMRCVMVTEDTDQSIARTVIQNTVSRDYTILVMDSMQSVTLNDANGGAAYLSIMEKNLEVFKEALE